jgi:hypothetical protein
MLTPPSIATIASAASNRRMVCIYSPVGHVVAPQAACEISAWQMVGAVRRREAQDGAPPRGLCNAAQVDQAHRNADQLLRLTDAAPSRP